MDINDRYVRGYLFRPASLKCDATAAWPCISVGASHRIDYHPKAEVCRHEFDGCQIVLIGRAYDADRLEREVSVLCEFIASAFRHGGRKELIRYTSGLGGRFIVIFADSEGVIVVPDCAATLAFHYSVTPDGLCGSSHWALTAEAAGAGLDQAAVSFMSSPEYVAPGGKYYPGLWTPYEGVKTLFANNALWSSCVSRSAVQRRFYPFQRLPVRSSASIQAEFEARLTLCTELSIQGTAVFSLTGGGDSRTTLAACVHANICKDLTAFTYIRSESADKAQFDDVFAASRRARQAKVPHLVFPVEAVDFSSDFHKWYAASFPRGARYPSLARAYYEHLPHDCTVLISTVAEIGTVFYAERAEKNPVPAALAEKFTQSAARSSPELIATMSEYIEETGFTEDALYGFDWQDLFYWEHRNSKWGSLWYAEVDMTGFAIVPYNDRRLIELMLSLPIEERRAKVLQKRMGDRHLPAS